MKSVIMSSLEMEEVMEVALMNFPAEEVWVVHPCGELRISPLYLLTFLEPFRFERHTNLLRSYAVVAS